MGEYFLPILMIVALIAGIFIGYPVAFLLAGLGVIFCFLADIPVLFLGTVVSRIFTGTLANWLLLAVPLFIFMGLMLEKSGAAKKLLLSLERLFAGMRGGLAISVALLGIVMAASTGIVGASVVLLGVLSLPVMLKQKYDKGLASGIICASGTLGILIPPSIMLVLVGDILQISVGDLFMGAMIPGLVLGALYIGYILAIAFLMPHKAPAGVVDVNDTRPLWLALASDLIAPVLLIMGVLGSIIAGIATPTEAAAIGAAGTMIMALFSGEMNYVNLRDTVLETCKTTGMILFVAIGATCFSVIFKRVGGDTMIEDTVSAFASGPYGTLAVLMILIFILGFFLEWIEISYIVLPLFAPIIAGLDFGLGMTNAEQLTWFAILVAINLQTSFLTPPFGYALFYLKGIAPPEISMGDIYRAIIPFVVLQLIGLGLAISFPSLVLWLPRYITG
ncbi:MAG: TRAP transporter large permease subunit [Alphaproteobacteria bacterium]|nr:TRAP transporter large permease subunit [Alphaproteobacteria bacterium]MBU0796231.1 TRAP transporter large permease subunit [Alphaproteobacteria bacterium]MBU0885730.1 TRAP transporter large permease subunit [Alphaproteobacteria bacterium]MBU1813116.1 TRAP transporter large permease subunit [Alphaproteobacteria bacterium]MBU2090823.1 TRAP transporter large permease subunit [Alphaproteobacteria bacterium]